MTDLVLRSRRVVTSTGVREAGVLVRGGVITAHLPVDQIPPNTEVVDYGDLVIMPGLVDTHVHVNEPGRTSWEGFATLTQAAAAGGITTIVDMPLNSIPATTTVHAFEQKLRAAESQCWVDTAFWGGLVAGNQDQIEPLIRAGVLGFKCFLVPSGVAEFEHVGFGMIQSALPVLRSRGVPLLVHAEAPELIAAAADALQGDPAEYSTYVSSRPPEAESVAIDRLIELAECTHAHVHIVHLAASQPVAALESARQLGVRITTETCPHYLYFEQDEVPRGATEFKCAPPIRDAANREALWRAVESGTIRMIVSDHSPCEPRLKQGDFLSAWGGIASLQFRLPIVWAGARERGHSFEALARWLCRAPAELAGLHNKGAIEPGRDADLVVWDPDAQLTITTEAIRHRHKVTPYLGETLPGVVRATYLRGDLVYNGRDLNERASGKLLLRSL